MGPTERKSEVAQGVRCASWDLSRFSFLFGAKKNQPDDLERYYVPPPKWLRKKRIFESLCIEVVLGRLFRVQVRKVRQHRFHVIFAVSVVFCDWIRFYKHR